MTKFVLSGEVTPFASASLPLASRMQRQAAARGDSILRDYKLPRHMPLPLQATSYSLLKRLWISVTKRK